MQSSIISVPWFLPWRFTTAGLIFLVARAVTAEAAPVNLYFDRAIAPIEFAAHEIVTASEEANSVSICTIWASSKMLAARESF